MKQIFIIVVLGFGFSSCFLTALSNESLNGQFNYKSEELQLISVLIDDDNFFKEWEKPELPEIREVTTYHRGDKVIPIIIVSSSATNGSGNADLSYNITITKPDKTIYGEFEDLVLWNNAPAPTLHLVLQPIIIQLEKTDPIGEYKVEITVNENINRQVIDFNMSFEVVESTILSSNEMEHQLSFYYQNPNPNRLLSLIRTVDDADIIGESSLQSPLTGFFTNAMAASTGSRKKLETTIEDLSNTRAFFSYCLSISSQKDTIRNWDGHSPTVNDILWGGFFATGDSLIIDRLVTEMKFCDEKNDIELYLTGASAKWSLSSNAEQHPLVRTYLLNLVDNVPQELSDHLHETLYIDSGKLRQKMVEGINRLKK